MSDPRLKQHPLGFFELINKPSQNELNAYYEKNYWQNESGNYRKQYSELELNVIHKRIGLRAAKFHELCVAGTGEHSKTRSLLDVGCGEGFVLKYFKDLGWSVKGIDFSRAGADQINPEYSSYIEQGDVFRLLGKHIHSQKKYNLVYMGNILEHVLDPVGLLRSLTNLVTKDGLLVVTVPNDGNAYHEWLLSNGRIPSRWWIAIPDHISYFTADSLRSTAEATGWDCLSMTADFPIDWYLAHEQSNYVVNKVNGPHAHQARLAIENLIANFGYAAANQFYESLAGVGLGRDITAYLRLK